MGNTDESGKKIRVLHVITRLIVGGAQENTMLTAEMLDGERFEVQVVSGPQTGPEGSLIEEVRARGIDLTIMPELVREVNPVKDALAMFRLTRFVKRGGYDIIHTHSSKAGILGRWAGRRGGAKVIIHTVHGWGHHDRQHPLVRGLYVILERLTAGITDRLIVVSDLNTQKGLRDGIGRAEQYVTIRSGIELDLFMDDSIDGAEVRRSLGIPAGAKVIGSVTRLSPQKDPLAMIRGASEAMRRHEEAMLVVVGDGPLRPEVEALVEEEGMAGRVLLTGLRRDVPRLLRAFDVFVLPSLWEGLPRVILQAMSAGLPVVATAADGTAEVVQDGVTGLLVPMEDTHALAEAIARLLRDPEGARRMGAEGKRRVQGFGADKMVRDIEELYTNLL